MNDRHAIIYVRAETQSAQSDHRRICLDYLIGLDLTVTRYAYDDAEPWTGMEDLRELIAGMEPVKKPVIVVSGPDQLGGWPEFRVNYNAFWGEAELHIASCPPSVRQHTYALRYMEVLRTLALFEMVDDGRAAAALEAMAAVRTPTAAENDFVRRIQQALTDFDDGRISLARFLNIVDTARKIAAGEPAGTSAG